MSLRPTAASLLGILREVNLTKLQQDAEQQVRLVVYGEPAQARKLAALLGGAPWVSVVAELSDVRASDLLLHVTTGAAEAVELPVNALRVSLGATSLTGAVILDDFSEDSLERSLAPAVLAAAKEDARLPLARRFPVLRGAYARWLIEQTSSSNAMFAASAGLAGVVPLLHLPLNVADIVVLTKNQLVMAYKLALAEGKSGKPAELMGEIVGVLGGGLFFRQIARELVGFIPIWGIVPKVAVAYAGTWAIGEAVHLWAAEGKTTTAKDMRQLYEKARGRGQRFAKRWQARRKPKGTDNSLESSNKPTNSASGEKSEKRLKEDT